MKNWKPIFIENSAVPVFLSRFTPIEIGAITVFFLVFSRGVMSEETKRHETIHFQQMLETLLLPFIILYCWDYIKGCIKYKNGKLAYYTIRAEQEAHQKASAQGYTATRQRWRWLWDYKV